MTNGLIEAVSSVHANETFSASALDLEIAPVVKQLRAIGLKTFASCGGQPGHKFSYPMVRIDWPDETANCQDEMEFAAHVRRILRQLKYDGFYVKLYLMPEYSRGFVEVEFWNLECLKPTSNATPPR